jgi:uncharacterized protein (TIGR02391 family)
MISVSTIERRNTSKERILSWWSPPDPHGDIDLFTVFGCGHFQKSYVPVVFSYQWSLTPRFSWVKAIRYTLCSDAIYLTCKIEVLMLFTDRFRSCAEVNSIRLQTLALALLDHLKTIIASNPRDSYRCVNLHTVCNNLGEHYSKLGSGRVQDFKRIAGEGWNWLASVGLIAQAPDGSDPRDYYVTRLGESVGSEDSLAEFEKRRCISPDVLHPAIREDCFGDFIIGDYETSVLKAFRLVEMTVREASRQEIGDNAVKMARTAFHQESGTLADQTELPGERQALSDLFAGALGRYRNPAAHGSREFNDPVETAELLMFASHLLKIVDSRRT